MIWNKESMVANSASMPVGSDSEDIWVELESDPGLFTLLIEDFGVRGVQVEEIYDLNSSILQNSTVYGFIFLFKWVEGGRRARGASITNSTAGTTVTDENVVNSMFFAQQIVTNACATHALLSILLNCDEDIELGPVLTQFKDQTFGMSPEAKGNAVGESGPLAWAHNKHARPDARRQTERDASSNETGRGKSVRRYRLKAMETFHFISYVPIHGRLYELDGLKSYPVDHGEIPPGMLWTQHFQNVISERIGLANSIQNSNEIRYNLMALVPSKKDQYQRSLEMLKVNRAILCDGLEKLLQATDPKVIEVARQQIKSPTVCGLENADDGDWRPDEKKPRLDEASLIDAARSLPSTQESTDLTAPLTVVTSSGGKTTFDFSVSSGVSDQSALNWPISTWEVVKVTKGSDATSGIIGESGGGNEGQTPSSTSPLSSFSEKEELERGNSDADAKENMENASEDAPVVTVVKQEVVDEAGPSDRSELTPAADVTKSGGMVVKLATSGSRGFGFFEPPGLATYIQRLDDKISTVERLLNDEISSRAQWEIEDQRRTHDYDAFIRTFVTMMGTEGILVPAEVPFKNGKAKGRKNERRGNTAGRKRRP